MKVVLKKLNGYSGSDVYLMQENNKIFIRKINNIERNYKQLSFLKELNYKVPKIYDKNENVLDMEYIQGLDIKTYIETKSLDAFIKFICSTIDSFSKFCVDKNYSIIYEQKLEWLPENNDFVFLKSDLIKKLPKILPQSPYHGDLTLENIIYSTDNVFYMIDAVEIEYDSWVFDLCKMRQDLSCGWFIRQQENKNLKYNLKIIEKEILSRYPIANNNYLLILMLLRVYRYATPQSFEQKFLMNEINKLWK